MILSRALRWTLEHVSRFLPVRTALGDDGTPYLSKYLLLGARRYRLCLHRFHRSDPSNDLHNHPWEYGISWILVGGYREEREIHRPQHRIGCSMIFPYRQTYERRPGEINVLLSETFHRVDLLDGECWTLFLAGPKAGSWGFLNRSAVYTPWREALEKRGIEIQEPWNTEKRWA